MRFARYLKEAKERTLVASFGRMNPPHDGHAKVINRVQSIANSYGADWKIYLSHSQDAKKNPLKPKRKLYWLHQMFPRYRKNIDLSSKVRTFIDMAKQASDDYDRLIVVAGDDRIKEYDRLLQTYNGRDYNFDSIEVISAGARDPNASGVEGMSASKLRGLVKSGDFDSFKRGVPLSEKDAMKLYDELRTEMGVSE